MNETDTTPSATRSPMQPRHVILGLFMGIVICASLFMALVYSVQFHGSGNIPLATFLLVVALAVAVLNLYLQFGRRMRGVLPGMLLSLGLGALVFGICVTTTW